MSMGKTPGILALIGGVLTIDARSIVTACAVIAGLVFGSLWRAGSLASEGKAWPDIRKDLLISSLIGGANAVLTLAIVDWMKAGLLVSMALGAIIGATGLRALPEIRDAMIDVARRRLGIEKDTP